MIVVLAVAHPDPVQSYSYGIKKKRKKGFLLPNRPTPTSLEKLIKKKAGLAGNRTPDHSHAKGVLYH